MSKTKKPQPVKKITPFYAGINGYRILRHIEEVVKADVSFGNGTTIVIKSGSAIYLSTQPIVPDAIISPIGIKTRLEEFTYGDKKNYMFIAFDRQQSNTHRYCEVINLDLIMERNSAAVVQATVTASELVTKFVAAMNKTRSFVKYPRMSELFPTKHGVNREDKDYDTLGYFPMQQLEEAIDAEGKPLLFSKLLQGAHDIWSPDASTTVGEVILGLMNFCGCGSLDQTVPEVIEAVIANYNPNNKYLYDYKAGKKIVEKYGEAAVDMVFAIFDKLEIIEHGGSVPGWLSSFGILILESLEPIVMNADVDVQEVG